jgi:hypothetical protein
LLLEFHFDAIREGLQHLPHIIIDTKKTNTG